MKYTIIFRVIYCRVQDIIGERLEVAQTASEALAEIKSSESLRRQKSGTYPLLFWEALPA